MRSIHSGQKNRKRTETRVVEFRQRMARLKRLTPLVQYKQWTVEPMYVLLFLCEKKTGTLGANRQ
jgi:hypothetical protein